jgi:hypothetical protein
MFNWFDAFMVKHKRKLLLADVYGNVIMHRYCLLRREETGQTIVNGSKKPQLYLHRFTWEDSPDGPSQHSHVGTTISLLLRKGYTERRDGKDRKRRPGSISFIPHGQTHKIVWAQLDTWTLFLRWYTRSADVRVVPEVCDVVCDYCKDKHGQCFNADREYTYSTYSKQFNNSKEATFRFPSWFHAGPETDRMLERRQRAMKRLGASAPVGTQNQLKVGQKYSTLPLLFDAETERKVRQDQLRHMQ